MAVLQRLVREEDVFDVQEALDEVHDHFTTMVQQPDQLRVAQQALAEALVELEENIDNMTSWYTPAFEKQLKELDLLPYFSYNIVNDIKTAMSANPLSHVVPAEIVASWRVRRHEALNIVRQTLTGLNRLNIKEVELQPGQAEIGFTIPRPIFDNDLDGLVSELREIRRIIRAFSEQATGSVEPIEIRQISTTDPTFFFGLEVLTIAAIGAAVTWALSTWQKLEEIRKIRAETRKIKGFGTKEIEKLFDDQIQNSVNEAIEEHVNSLLGKPKGQAGRINEQRTDLLWATRALFARMERGMTVEIRFLSPPSLPSKQEDGSDAVGKTKGKASDVYEVLDKIADELVFPQIDEAPVLSLIKEESKSTLAEAPD